MLPTINTALLAVRIDQFHDVVLGTVDSFTVAKDEVLWLRCRIWSPPRNQQAWMDHSASLCNICHVFLSAPIPCRPSCPCSKRRVSSQPPATKFSSTATNCASCSAWFDPSQSQGTWKCGHVDAQGQAPEEHILESLLDMLLYASFTDFFPYFPGFMPFMPSMPSMHFRIVSFTNLHSCIRWNSGGWVSSRVSWSRGSTHIHGASSGFFCKATRHGLQSFMKDKKKVSQSI